MSSINNIKTRLPLKFTEELVADSGLPNLLVEITLIKERDGKPQPGWIQDVELLKGLEGELKVLGRDIKTPIPQGLQVYRRCVAFREGQLINLNHPDFIGTLIITAVLHDRVLVSTHGQFGCTADLSYTQVLKTHRTQ